MACCKEWWIGEVSGWHVVKSGGLVGYGMVWV